MSKLTPEQKQNLAALRAAYEGKPWQYLSAAEEWVTPFLTGKVAEFLNQGYPCRPAPEPEPPKPWTIEEAAQNAGKVVVRKDIADARYVIIHTNGSMVWVGAIKDPITVGELFHNWEMSDGSPCGTVKEAK